MALDFETAIFIIAGFVILILVFFLMLRSSSNKIVKKFGDGDTKQQKVDERLAKLSASVSQNSKDIEQIKKMLSEGRLNKIGPFDDSVAKQIKRVSDYATIDPVAKPVEEK
jgi:hypothetical protein